MGCRVCAHPERQAIERATRTTDYVVDVAVHFGVSSRALERHILSHASATDDAPIEDVPPTTRSAA